MPGQEARISKWLATPESKPTSRETNETHPVLRRETPRNIITLRDLEWAPNAIKSYARYPMQTSIKGTSYHTNCLMPKAWEWEITRETNDPIPDIKWQRVSMKQYQHRYHMPSSTRRENYSSALCLAPNISHSNMRYVRMPYRQSRQSNNPGLCNGLPAWSGWLG